MKTPNLALFDFDGTITTEQMFVPFMEYVSPSWRMTTGRLLLFPLIALYRINLFSAAKLRCIVNFFIFFGRDTNEVFALGNQFANEVIPKYLRENALRRIRWHKSQGDDVVVVSASLNAYLVHWCKQHNIALICSELAVKNGRFSGLLVAGDCSSEEKKNKVLARYNLANYERIYAYGDTKEDDAMLSLACEKYMNWKKVA